MTEVPYRGTAPALTDLAAGVVDVLVDAVATMAPMHKAGQIKILGNFDGSRSPVAPDVPTFAESGFPDLVAFTWNALLAPAGTPQPVIDKLNAAALAALEAPAVRRRLEDAGFIPQPSTPAALARYIREEYDRWGPLIQRLGIRLD
jgi:tripartite-type tricarboxylate transporter receptor subunit TctC